VSRAKRSSSFFLTMVLRRFPGVRPRTARTFATKKRGCGGGHGLAQSGSGLVGVHPIRLFLYMLLMLRSCFYYLSWRSVGIVHRERVIVSFGFVIRLRACDVAMRARACVNCVLAFARCARAVYVSHARVIGPPLRVRLLLLSFWCERCCASIVLVLVATLNVSNVLVRPVSSNPSAFV
jgi:hypothetical protein